MGKLRLGGSIKSEVSFAKEPHQRDNVLQKRPIILSILLTLATPYVDGCVDAVVEAGGVVALLAINTLRYQHPSPSTPFAINTLRYQHPSPSTPCHQYPRLCLSFYLSLSHIVSLNISLSCARPINNKSEQ